LTFVLTGDRITELRIAADPDRLHSLRMIELDASQLFGQAAAG
jgi:hypothetical protein